MNRKALFIPLAFFLGISLLLWYGLHQERGILPSALIDKPIPEFALPTLARENLSIGREDLPDELYLLNVWATWCVPCRVEHPYLVSLAERQQVTIVGLNYKDDRAAALKWLEERGDPYRLTIFDNKGKLGLDLGVYGAPETYLVDRQGVIRFKHVGVLDQKVWDRDFKPIIGQLQQQASES